MNTSAMPTAYRGRFAPSPTGPLHIGSLVSALGSWADAKYHHGGWTVRIENIDPERESSESIIQILDSLKAHGLQWDDDVSYQHLHSERYDNALDNLRQQNRLFACTCTRKKLRALDISNYPGTCRSLNHPEEDKALRVKIDSETIEFDDLVCGRQSEDVSQTVGDFIVRRRGPLYAYQLAVVVDDAAQNITHVVRGADLLDNTARQIALQRLLNYPTPAYLHLPLAKHADGRKLSKQTGAAPLDDSQALQNLQTAWNLLGQTAPKGAMSSCAAFLTHCAAHWDRQRIPTHPLDFTQ